jgi:hypothetical protein
MDDSCNTIAWGNGSLVNSAAERFYDSREIAADNSTGWQGYKGQFVWFGNIND